MNLEEQRLELEKDLHLPIQELQLNEEGKICYLVSPMDNIYASLHFDYNEAEEIDYNWESLNVNWEQLVNEYDALFSIEIAEYLEVPTSHFQLKAIDLYKVHLVDLDDNFIAHCHCEFIEGHWSLKIYKDSPNEGRGTDYLEGNSLREEGEEKDSSSLSLVLDSINQQLFQQQRQRELDADREFELKKEQLQATLRLDQQHKQFVIVLTVLSLLALSFASYYDFVVWVSPMVGVLLGAALQSKQQSLP